MWTRSPCCPKGVQLPYSAADTFDFDVARALGEICAAARFFPFPFGAGDGCGGCLALALCDPTPPFRLRPMFPRVVLRF